MAYCNDLIQCLSSDIISHLSNKSSLLSVCFSVKSEEGRRTIKVGILSKVLEVSKVLLLIYRHLKYASHILYTIKTKITQMTYRSTKMTEKGYQVRI